MAGFVMVHHGDVSHLTSVNSDLLLNLNLAILKNYTITALRVDNFWGTL